MSRCTHGLRVVRLRTPASRVALTSGPNRSLRERVPRTPDHREAGAGAAITRLAISAGSWLALLAPCCISGRRNGVPGRHIRRLQPHRRRRHAHSPVTDFAPAWVWAAACVWLVVFERILRRGPRLAPCRVCASHLDGHRRAGAQAAPLGHAKAKRRALARRPPVWRSQGVEGRTWLASVRRACAADARQR